ncbi:MAG: restriction endonuclease subunit S [Xanthobacteraceae bacterium]|nr:MAG: restriction endonuclease subunit S [Xanthobacteraceae bacterium]
MNAERLLAHYEQIADAPDAIARLRRFILDLAVRGKLVPQDAGDEPASELLKRIAKEKARLVKTGEARRLEVGPVGPADAPYLIPSNWKWTRLGSIADWGSGSTPPRDNLDFYGGGITWLKSGELNDKRALAGSEETVTPLAIEKGSFRINNPGDVLIAMYGATIGKVAILAEIAVTNQAVCGCTPFEGISNQFLFLFLLSQRKQFHSASEGGAQPNISKVKIVWTPFPLPPLAEQHRIVAKVDELMGLCDRLEAARVDREATRDRLAAASLASLNAPDPETFQDDARFALDALPALTTRPDQIKRLRQTILNLAVRGKLVPQDANDEPAAELLKRIAKEKARLVKAGEIRKQKAIPAQSEAPFAIPSNWRWSQLAEIGILSPRNEAPDTLEASFVPMPLIAVEYGAANQHEVRRWGEIKKGYTHFTEGDVGLAKITPCFENGKSTVFRKLTGGIGAGTTELHIVRPLFVDQDYILLFLKSPHFIEAGIPKMTGTAGQKRVPTEYFAHSPFPLPPLAEQHRIVAKVDELMGLCGRLEASLTATAATSRRLLDALLAEALAPAEDRELEAAE